MAKGEKYVKIVPRIPEEGPNWELRAYGVL